MKKTRRAKGRCWRTISINNSLFNLILDTKEAAEYLHFIPEEFDFEDKVMELFLRKN